MITLNYDRIWHCNLGRITENAHKLLNPLSLRGSDGQLDLFAKRTSSKHWWSNQWQHTLSMLAFVLFEKLREHCSKKYDTLSVQSLRLKLIKIAAVVVTNTCRIHFLLSEYCPGQKEFMRLVERLLPSLLT